MGEVCRSCEVSRSVGKFHWPVAVSLCSEFGKQTIPSRIVSLGGGDMGKVELGDVLLGRGPRCSLCGQTGSVQVSALKSHDDGEVGSVNDGDKQVLVVAIVGQPDSAAGSELAVRSAANQR